VRDSFGFLWETARLAKLTTAFGACYVALQGKAMQAKLFPAPPPLNTHDATATNHGAMARTNHGDEALKDRVPQPQHPPNTTITSI
jgi:hypothetical protein